MRIVFILSILFFSACNLIQHRGISFETVSRDTANNFYSLNMTYPLFHAPNQLITLNDSINKVISKHTSYYRGNEFKDIKKLLMEINTPESPARRYQTTIDYQPFLINSSLISIRFKIYEYTLGAHGNTFFVSLNYNPKDNTFFQAKDIIKTNHKDVNNKLIDLLKKYKNDPQQCVTIDENVIQNIQHINFNSNRTIFTFAPYEIAAYSCGTIQIEIPTHILIKEQIISKQFSTLISRN